MKLSFSIAISMMVFSMSSFAQKAPVDDYYDGSGHVKVIAGASKTGDQISKATGVEISMCTSGDAEADVGVSLNAGFGKNGEHRTGEFSLGFFTDLNQGIYISPYSYKKGVLTTQRGIILSDIGFRYLDDLDDDLQYSIGGTFGIRNTFKDNNNDMSNVDLSGSQLALIGALKVGKVIVDYNQVFGALAIRPNDSKLAETKGHYGSSELSLSCKVGGKLAVGLQYNTEILKYKNAVVNNGIEINQKMDMVGATVTFFPNGFKKAKRQ